MTANLPASPERGTVQRLIRRRTIENLPQEVAGGRRRTEIRQELRITALQEAAEGPKY